MILNASHLFSYDVLSYVYDNVIPCSSWGSFLSLIALQRQNINVGSNNNLLEKSYFRKQGKLMDENHCRSAHNKLEEMKQISRQYSLFIFETKRGLPEECQVRRKPAG